MGAYRSLLCCALCRADRHQAHDHEEAAESQALPRLPSHSRQEAEDHHTYPSSRRLCRGSWGHLSIAVLVAYALHCLTPTDIVLLAESVQCVWLCVWLRVGVQVTV